jgi:hypothetical protein
MVGRSPRQVPLPLDERIPNFPHCPPCCARFYLESAAAWGYDVAVDTVGAGLVAEEDPYM